MTDGNAAALSGKFVNFPTKDIYFGPASVNELGRVLERDGIERAIVVTGRSLVANKLISEPFVQAIGARCAGIFCDTVPHTPRDAAIAAARFARSKNADALISFGGSTPSDTAKAAVLALAQDIDHPDAFDSHAIRFEYGGTQIVPPVTGAALPIYAVPTTLSAGEFTSIAGITDPARRHKQLYQDRKLASQAVFLDPCLTLATPDWLWLSSGVKAIDHCVEAMLSTRAQPITDALARQAFGTLMAFLPICRSRPQDLAARVECQVAAWLSVAGLSNVSLGLSHGIGHQLGGISGVPHGYTSCVMLQHVVGFNRDVTLERQAALAKLAALPEIGDTRISACALQQAILRLVRDELGLPWRLRDVGVERCEFPVIARSAIHDPIVATNPRRIESEQDIIDMLERAW